MPRHPEIELAVKNAKNSLNELDEKIFKRLDEIAFTSDLIRRLLNDEKFCALMHDREGQMSIIRSFPDQES